MDFKTLHELVPYAKGGKAKVLTMSPYNGITLAMPGRHAKDTVPVGGDFVVMVDDATKKWTKHQFTHKDLFKDMEAKAKASAFHTDALLDAYLAVIKGGDPDKLDVEKITGLHSKTFLYAVQCLAVAEHRRYHQHEEKFGGRYLPFRFVAGIVEGLWTAAEAADKQKYGRPAVERLEKQRGVPALSKELMSP